MPRKIIHAHDLSIPDLRSLWSGNELVLLLGSGISLWSPTNLPTGKDLKDGIFAAVFRDELGRPISSPEKQLADLYSPLPFEVVNSRCPDTDRLRALLAKLFLVFTPNPVHRLIAELAEDESVHSIITPNYDCALDQALADAYQGKVARKIGDIHRIFADTDVPNNHSSQTRTYLKLHGSADDASLRSLVFHLNQEGMLNLWKRDVFRRLIRGRAVLIIGYSGTDFDITPEIPHAEPSIVIWNRRDWDEDDVHPNPVAVANKIPTVFLIGDMRKVLSRMFRPVQADFGTFDLDFEEMLRGEFTLLERQIWRVRLLNSLTFNTLSLSEIEKLKQVKHDPHLEAELLSEFAGASASFGRYRDAALAHEQAARTLETSIGNEEQSLGQLLLASDAWRSHGHFIRAFRLHRRASRRLNRLQLASSSLEAAFLRNEALLLLPLYELLSTLRLGPLANKVQSLASETIQEASQIYRELGEWYPLQQLRLWSERFDLDPEVTTVFDEYRTYPSLEGYIQLNFPMGRMMAFRHGIRLGRIPISAESASQAESLALEAKQLGITPEVWKLHLLKLGKYRDSSNVRDSLSEFRRAFMACQYTLLFRLWQLYQGG